MEAIHLQVNPADSTAIMDQDLPYMGCQSLPTFIPSTLYTHPPPPDKMPAIFSTRLGKLPVCYIPQGQQPVVIRTDLYSDIFYTAEKYIAGHPEAVNKIEFWPTSYASLYEYFDPYDLWMQGAQFLFLVIHRLAWYTLTKKRRIERLVTTWCTRNIPKLAKLPFVGSPVKMLLDAEDWHYFNFSNIPEHDMNLICHKLDRAAYDIKPQVDQYKEFLAASTPAPITPVSPIKQRSDGTQDAAIINGPSATAISNGAAQEQTVPREPSHQTHATLHTPSYNGNGQVAHQNIPSAPPGGITHAPYQQQIQIQSQTLHTTTVALSVPASMGNEFSRHALQRASSGYSIDETLAELKDEDYERVPRVALPGQLNRPPSPDPQNPFIISKLYNEKVDYSLAAAEGRLLSIRLTDTYDTAVILRSDFVLKMLVTCGEIESYRPYNAHAEMSFYSPRAAKDAADIFNGKRFGADGFRLIILLVQPFNNSPFAGSKIDYDSHNNFVGRREFSPQDARMNSGAAERGRVNTGSSWASAPVFTPMTTPQIQPQVGPHNEASFAPAIGGGTHGWRATRPPALNPYPVSRHRAPHDVMPNMLGMNRTPSMALQGTPTEQPVRLPHAYQSTPLLGPPMGQPARQLNGHQSMPLVGTAMEQPAGPPKRYPSTPLIRTPMGQPTTLPNEHPIAPLAGTPLGQPARQPNRQQHEQQHGQQYEQQYGQQHGQQYGQPAANGYGHTEASSSGRGGYKMRGQPYRNNPGGYQSNVPSILRNTGAPPPNNTPVQPAPPPEQNRQPEAEAALFNDEIVPPTGASSNNDADALRSILDCVTAPVTETEVAAAPSSELPKSRPITRLEEVETVVVAALPSEAEVKQTSSDEVEVSPEDTKSTDAGKKIRRSFEPYQPKSNKTSPKSGDEDKDAMRADRDTESSARGGGASRGRGGKRNKKKGGGKGLVPGENTILSPTGWPSLSSAPSAATGENTVSPIPVTMRTSSGRRDSMAEIASRARRDLEKKEAAKEVRPSAAAGRRAEKEKGKGKGKEVEWQGRKLSMASEWEVEREGGGRTVARTAGMRRGESQTLRRDWVRDENWKGKRKWKEGEGVEEW